MPKEVKAVLTRKQEEEIAKCRDVRYWMKHYVFTLDEHDAANPIKKMPYYFEGELCPTCNATWIKADGIDGGFCLWCNPESWKTDGKHRAIIEKIDSDPARYGLLYQSVVIDQWIRENLCADVKSRQIMFTWLAVAYEVHSCLFLQGQNNIFQSEKEYKAKRLIQRACFIIEHLPAWMRVANDPSTQEIEFTDNYSRIASVPQGATQIESETVSSLFSDEVVEQIEAGDSFNRAYPALAGSGKYKGISKAGPGWFYAVCTDRLDEANELL